MGKKIYKQSDEQYDGEKNYKNVRAKDPFLSRSSKRGNKNLRERALGKDAAKKVWKFKRDEKNIAINVGAECGSSEKIANET